MYKSAKLMIAGALLSITVATPAVADISANIGLLSDYFYRGVVQNTTATTNGGLDYYSISKFKLNSLRTFIQSKTVSLRICFIDLFCLYELR